MSVQPIPPGYHSVTPYIIVNDAKRAIEFYKNAFGATEVLRLDGPGGSVAHAEVKIGDSHVMLADENQEFGAISPKTLGGVASSLLIYCEDVDTMFQRALAAGAVEKRPVVDQFYGDSSGVIEDPYGHTWSIATHKEDLTQAEVDARFAQMMQQQ
jgi:PhnB protein